MSTATPSKTRIIFDLEDVLTPEELISFQRSAEEAHAPTLTDHLLNLTLRLAPKVHHDPDGRAAYASGRGAALPQPEGKN
jgi:hypothetical protein